VDQFEKLLLFSGFVLSVCLSVVGLNEIVMHKRSCEDVFEVGSQQLKSL
jgi:hypothetical protein